MLPQILALLVLALSAEELVSHPASPEDKAARVAFFDSLVKVAAIEPCKRFLPDQARVFDQSYARWLKDNATAIAQGEESFRNAAAPEPFDRNDFPVDEAEAQFTAILDGLSPKERLSWCREHF